ncbi:MAG TPA: molybdate ABC transporter substrate-binding protein [Casimicrobiaceae bacterium]|nr:molybdate ABC transporter substrate-binding protein [Casimicrobiaceae bacterium]
MHRSSKLAFVVAFVVLAFGAPAIVRAAQVTVFAAASLKEAMDAQAHRFESTTGDKVVVSYAASSALAKQIVNGAPADVFISADLDWMDYLAKLTLLAPGTRFDLLRNSLVLIAPAQSSATLRITPGFALAAALDDGRLAIANPDSVPAGKYAKEALEHLGVWKSVEHRLARTDNVRAALALVSRGEAPFGIVYETDALADKHVKIVDRFPEASHAPIVYPVALVAGRASATARRLLDDLRSPAARATWEKYGFEMAD